MELTLYCEHVNEKHIHCNECKHIIIKDKYETIAHYIRVSDWCIVDGEVRCPDHK
jgi:hypothetical protein